MNKHYDITIVGAGIVGLTLALALAKRKFKVILLEKNTSIENIIAQSKGRVSAINLASQAIFTSLGVWPRMQQRASPFEQIRVFEPTQTYELQFDSALIGKPYLGYIVDHSFILQVLNDALLQHSGEIRYQSVIRSLTLEKEKAKITLETGEVIESHLIVGADGMHSKMRDLAGITIKERDYHQTALVTQVHTEKPHQKIAWQCFRPTGPLAFLPLKEAHHCSIVWSTSLEEAASLQKLPDDTFSHRLQTAFENRLGEIQVQSSRIQFPLKMRYAKEFVKPHFALVGDAIHTIHPLAGQGLNLGLLDAACLAEVIAEAPNNMGDYRVLRRYARWRKSPHLATIAAMEIFKQGFAASTFPLPWIRERCMQQFNQTNFLKRWCVNFATGLSDLPRICHDNN